MPTIMSPDERTLPSSHMRWGPSLGPEVSDQGPMQPREGPPRAWALRTDGAVLAVPSGAALALAVAAGPVLGAARVAGPLVTGRSRPAILATARASHAGAVATTVSSTDLCGKGERREGQTRARRGKGQRREGENKC